MLSVHQRLKRVNIAQNAHNTIDKPCAEEKQGKGGRGKSLLLSDFLLPTFPEGFSPSNGVSTQIIQNYKINRDKATLKIYIYTSILNLHNNYLR